MNKFIRAVTDLDVSRIEEMLRNEPKWAQWSEKSGKNALHYLCGLKIGDDRRKSEAALEVLKLLLQGGMDINSVHLIADDDGDFPATPLWYAYTKGRNEKLFTYLLENGAAPDNCQFAIAWYDDVEAAELFKKYGARVEDGAFLSAIDWKRFRIAEWFLRNGINVRAADDMGNTALHYAVKRKFGPDQVKLLLRFGAEFDRKNKEGLSPRELAELTGQKKLLGLFSAADAAGLNDN